MNDKDIKIIVLTLTVVTKDLYYFQKDFRYIKSILIANIYPLKE